MPVEFTFITSDGRLSKAFRRRDGRLEKLPGGALHHGRGQRMRVSTGAEFNEVLQQAGPCNALTCGITADEEVRLASQELAQPGEITRTRSNFRFPDGPGLLFVDYDPQTEILAPEELDARLQAICPEIGAATRVVRDSTSSHILDMETGEVLVGRRGIHEYVVVKDGSDIARAGRVLFCRAVLAGHGAPFITKSGIVFLRTLVDLAVFQPERLIFVGGADTEWPLEQRRPPALVFEGNHLDTRVALPDLTSAEEVRFQEQERVIIASVQEEAAAVRAAWIEDRVIDHERRIGRSLTDEERQLQCDRLSTAATTSSLPDEFVLHHQGGTITVGEMLADLARWNGATFADPLEPGYHGGELLAKLIVKSGKQPYMWSFAHGGIVYNFASTPPTPPPPASSETCTGTTTTPPPAPTEQELVERFRAIPADTPSDQLPEALKPVVSMMRATSPITASKVIKQAASHLGVGATVLGKQIKEIEKELDEEEEQPEEDACLKIARGVNELTRGELVCIEPPAKPSVMPVFHRKQPEGHLAEVPPEQLHDLFNGVAGRPLEPPEFTLVAWFLASSVLQFRGGEILQTGLLCQNGYLSFDLGQKFTPGRPKQPCVFFVPRRFIEDPALLPPLESLKIVQDWGVYGQDIVGLLEVIARVLLTGPTGRYVLFWGPGGEGKTTFLKFVEALVGPHNVLHAELSNFRTDRRLRGIADTRGKLIVWFDDAPADIFDVLGPYVKETSTAECMTGARMYEDAASFPNTALIVIASNLPSQGADRSRGAKDRRLLYVWSNRIRSTQADRMATEKVWLQNTDELDVIFSYAVHLAFSYLATGRFHYEQMPEDTQCRVDALTSVECRYLWQRFEQAPGEFIPWEKIEVHYNLWWPDYKHRPAFSHARFLAAVETTWSGEADRRQIDGDRERGVSGIRLLPLGRVVTPTAVDTARVLEDLIRLQSGQKTPRIAGNPSEEEEKKEEEEEEDIFQEHEEVSPADVGNPGHLDPQQVFSEPSEENAKYVQIYEGIRDLVPGRVRKENGLHLDRLKAMFPPKMAAFARPLIDELVAAGLVTFDGVWVHSVDPEEEA